MRYQQSLNKFQRKEPCHGIQLMSIEILHRKRDCKLGAVSEEACRHLDVDQIHGAEYKESNERKKEGI